MAGFLLGWDFGKWHKSIAIVFFILSLVHTFRIDGRSLLTILCMVQAAFTACASTLQPQFKSTRNSKSTRTYHGLLALCAAAIVVVAALGMSTANMDLYITMIIAAIVSV